uniref:Protein FAR1-RELATED SEQUENCE n=1 Tax=Chenopodium quinoa TaxID=63459 RepID=A0A803M0D1_CHEQI
MEYLETTEDIERYNSGGELGPSIPEAVDDECGEVDCATALELLLNQVIVGEESFKTPTKGKGNVSISIQIEEAGEVEMDVALPPPSIGMVFESMIEVDKYFREHGQQNGFGVVRASAANNGKGAKRNCLYEERAMWVPAFLKHLFWAGMRTTQRVESIHSFFDGYLSRHTLLHEFVERYVEALEVRATAEKKADDNNARYVRKAYSDFPAELIFQKIYTDAKFKEVQRECSRVWYKPKNCTKEKPSKRKRRYKITFDCVSKEASCDCKHFECHGIICHHIIKVYELNDHYEIPDKFILRRWRKDVIRKHTRVKVAYHDPNKTYEVCRYDKMMVKFGSLSTKACVYKTTTDLVMQSLQLLEIQVDEKISMINGSNAQGEGRGEKGTPVTPSTQRQGSCSEVPKDPPMPKRPAHRTTAVRFPSFVEKSTKGGKTNNKRNTKKSSQVENDSQCTPSYATPSYSQVIFRLMGPPHGFVFPYSPHSIGGIQMVDADGSIGYFTGVSGANTPHTPSVNMSGTDGQSVYHHHYIPVVPCTEAVATPSTPNSATPPASGNYRPIAPKPVFLPFGPYHHQQYVQAYYHQYLHPNQHPHELRIRPNGTNQHANGTTNAQVMMSAT